MPTDNSIRDILITGAGPAGMIAALELAAAGWKVTLAGPRATLDDRRTTALMAPSLARLDALGLGAALRRDGAPLRVMRIVDATRRLIRSAPATFHASEVGLDAFGWNFPNLSLNAALADAVAASSAIERIEAPVDHWVPGDDSVRAHVNGREVDARLVVAADGRKSSARDAAAIAVKWTEWPQAALVLTFAHTRPHGQVSTEFHTPDGPCVQVPLPGNRSSLVWVNRPDRARELMAFADADLARAVEDRLESILGKVSLEPGRQVWPLANAVPERFAARRVALVGEAAHIFPPIGAQGLNLSIRDAADLVTAIAGAGDPGADAVLARYDGLRRPDVHARLAAVSLLNRSLLSDFLPSQMARAAGLGLLGRIAPLRAFFMREGMHPGDGFRAVFSGLREKIGR